MADETILVVDDEPHIIELTSLYLQNAGYHVETAADGAEALEKIVSIQPALIVLDLMLPKVDGWDVCRRTRAESDVPIIMLTARDDDIDKIVGLELGADDYLTKPFNPRELVARIRAVLRRRTPPPTTEVLVAGDLRLDTARREARIKESSIEMRPREFDLLSTLVEHRGIVMSREQLLSLVWGYDYYGETRTVDVHIAHLRDKLAGSQVRIETVWGIGYKLIVE